MPSFNVGGFLSCWFMFYSSALLPGFDWASLKKGDLVVDVGGGVGSSTLVLAKQYPDLKFVVQDLPQTIKDAETVSTSSSTFD
jgi:tRNA G46 methylase TrmB